MAVRQVANVGNVTGCSVLTGPSRRVRSWVAACAAALALVACGGDGGQPGASADTFPVGTLLGASAEAEIGAAGGQVTLGGVQVTVPAGAVLFATTFRISEISRTAPHGGARAYRLEPHGARFAVPVEITFALDDDDPGAPLALYQDDEGHWLGAPDSSYDAATHSLRVATTHFSDWTYAEAFLLEATSYSVRTGESLELVVKSCYARDFLDADGYVVPALVETCEAVSGEALLDAESVNGAPGGDAQHGTVTRQGGELRYSAPATVPTANPVAVSVRLEDIGRETEVLLVANVTVVDDVAFAGTTTAANGSFSAEVAWTESESFGEEVQYVPSGTVHYAVEGCTVTPSAGQISPEDGYMEIDYSQSPPRYYGSGYSTFEVTVTCGESSSPWTILAPWFESGGPRDASADGRTLHGTSAQGTWHFERTP